jgi:hypothetical protein
MQLNKQSFEKLLHPPSSPALSALFQKDPCHPAFYRFFTSSEREEIALEMRSPLGERKKLNTQCSFSSL